MSPAVKLWRLGRVRYLPALRLQQRLAARIKTEDPDAHVVLALEHDPVYTTGMRTGEYSAQEESRLRALGADFVRTDRGGLITFHGPGQLVVYPILNLSAFAPSSTSSSPTGSPRRRALLGMKWYVHQLEQSVIDACSSMGVATQRSPHTGVWVGEDSKVCAMGVHNSGLVTTHGLALNCDNDLAWFEHVVPCGIVGKGVTSLSSVLGRTVGTEEALSHLTGAMEDNLGCALVEEDCSAAEAEVRSMMRTRSSDGAS